MFFSQLKEPTTYTCLMIFFLKLVTTMQFVFTNSVFNLHLSYFKPLGKYEV